MSDLTLNILGFPAANRDLKVELRDPISNNLISTVQPFLDGTTRFSRLDPGAYEAIVLHPNLPTPILRRPIRVLPTGETKISVVIDPTLFRNTPIEDIPDANLTPVQQAAASVGETLAPLAQKQPGEAIRAQDWNIMASSIRDLAQAVAELTRLVSPIGHDHPEHVRKFDEINDNFNTLVSTLNASMAELQRQIQAVEVRRRIEEVLTVAGIDRESVKGQEILALAHDLDQTATDTPRTYAQKQRNIAIQLQQKVETIVEEQPELIDRAEILKLSEASNVMKQTRAGSYEAELEMHRNFNRAVGGALINARSGGFD